MQAQTLVMLVTSTIGFAAGSVFLKHFADTGKALPLIAAFSIFALANLAYARVIVHGLGQGAVLSGMTHLILMSALGVLIFGEKMSERQFLALGLALTAAWMMAAVPERNPA